LPLPKLIWVSSNGTIKTGKLQLRQVEEASAALELAREEMNRYQQLANTGAIAEQVKEKEQAFTAQARLKGAEATRSQCCAGCNSD